MHLFEGERIGEDLVRSGTYCHWDSLTQGLFGAGGVLIQEKCDINEMEQLSNQKWSHLVYDLSGSMEPLHVSQSQSAEQDRTILGKHSDHAWTPDPNLPLHENCLNALIAGKSFDPFCLGDPAGWLDGDDSHGDVDADIGDGPSGSGRGQSSGEHE